MKTLINYTFDKINWTIDTFRVFKYPGLPGLYEIFLALLQKGGEETDVIIRRIFKISFAHTNWRKSTEHHVILSVLQNKIVKTNIAKKSHTLTTTDVTDAGGWITRDLGKMIIEVHGYALKWLIIVDMTVQRR